MPKLMFRPPRLRINEGGEEERHATWMELFYDLLFVAVVAQLSLQLSHDLSPFGILRFVLLFVPVWWAWIGQAFYATRFDTDDLGHRLFIIAQMFAIAAMGVTVHEGFSQGSAGFALSYAAVRFILVGEYIGADVFVPAARKIIRRFEIGFGIAATIWLISAFVAPPYRFVLWGIGMLVDFGTPLTAGKLHAQLPPHAVHLPERFALFTLIILGESITGVISGLSRQHWSPASVVAAMLGLSLAFSLWWVYFDNVDAAPIRAARTGGRIWLYQTWLYAHLPLVIGLTATAVGVEYVVSSPQDMVLPLGERWLICGGVALVLLSLGLIHLTTVLSRAHPRNYGHVAYHFGGAAALIILGAVGSFRPLSLIGLIALACALQVIREVLSQLRAD
jgi:low temperature requirement protein LtrA